MAHMITVLDAATLGEDIDLSVLNSLGEVQVHASTLPFQVAERIQNSDIVVVNKVILNRANLQEASQVKLICVAATGTNNVDLEYTLRRGIVVSNVAGYSTRSVVQHTFAMLFYILESSAYYDHYVKSGRYASSEIFTHLGRPFWELYGKTWGIIGLGTIGQAVAKVAQQFGCQVIYYSTSGVNIHPDYHKVTLDELLEQADVVSIHAPLNQQTQNLLHYEQFKRMKRHAILLNLGRGGIVNEQDLAAALDERLIGGAGLDVLEREPITADNPLMKIGENQGLYITPHIAWASREARRALVKEIALNIQGYLDGHPRNIVL